MLNKMIRLIFVSVATIAIFTVFACYLVSAGLALPLEISEGSSLLAQVFGVSGLIWIVVYCGTSNSGAPTVKLIGSVLVLALAFASNSSWTYALSIFIVATLVTELEFLEKLAALFTNRKEYWEWRSKQSTDAEAQTKALVDAIDEESDKRTLERDSELDTPEMEGDKFDGSNSPAELDPILTKDSKLNESKSYGSVDQGSSDSLGLENEAISRAQERAIKGLQFARRVITAIRSGKSPFGQGDVLENMMYQKGPERLDIDAVVRLQNIHYVVEIKFAMTAGVIERALWKAQHLAAGYTKYLRSTGVTPTVRAALILPLGAKHQSWKSRYSEVDVYLFQPSTGEFIRMN